MGGQFATLGANVPTFINFLTSMFYHLLVTWGNPKMLKVGLKCFLALTPSVKQALTLCYMYYAENVYLNKMVRLTK